MWKKILAVILFIVLYLTVFDVFVEGPVGLSLRTYSCMGMIMPSDHAFMKKMPEKNVGFKYPFNFRYEVGNGNSGDFAYCLGKNVYKVR